MKIVFSVPTGFHARELLIPLKTLLEQDTDIERVYCLTPGAPYQAALFPDYDNKFEFIANPANLADHQKLIKRLSPDIVITNTSGLDPNDIPILKAAKAKHIPTLTFVASWDNVWKMERFKNQDQPQIIADHLIVWNQINRDHLLRIFPDLDPENISITGPPRFDAFWHPEQIPDRRQLLSFLDLPDDGSKLIHFATTELYPMEYVIKTIAAARQQGSIKHKLHLYTSVHPGGNMAKHEQYARKHNVAVRYSFGRRDKSPHPDFLYNPTLDDVYMLIALFKHADLLINQSSTVAIESLAGDTPIINVKYGRSFDWWRWYRSMVYRDFKQHYRNIIAEGATKVVSNPRQLITAVNEYLNHPEQDQLNRQRTLEKMITTIDGTASKKVLDHIKQLL